MLKLRGVRNRDLHQQNDAITWASSVVRIQEYHFSTRSRFDGNLIERTRSQSTPRPITGIHDGVEKGGVSLETPAYSTLTIQSGVHLELRRCPGNDRSSMSSSAIGFAAHLVGICHGTNPHKLCLPTHSLNFSTIDVGTILAECRDWTTSTGRGSVTELTSGNLTMN